MEIVDLFGEEPPEYDFPPSYGSCIDETSPKYHRSNSAANATKIKKFKRRVQQACISILVALF